MDKKTILNLFTEMNTLNKLSLQIAQTSQAISQYLASLIDLDDKKEENSDVREESEKE